MAELSAFECIFRLHDVGSTLNALSAGKARYDYLLGLRDSYPDVTFADIKVRRVGPPVTSAAFRRTAQYRGMPDLVCGEKVTVGGHAAVIVGHNDSANFDVVFTDGFHGGHHCNVHPSEIQRAPRAEAAHG